MDGIIFNIKRYAIHDGPGIRTTVFLKGCSLRCRWCHNPESQQAQIESMWQVKKLNDRKFEEKQTVGYTITPRKLLTEIQKDLLFFEESGGGVTFSGGEPLLQSAFLSECLQLCRENSIHTCIDTAGVAPDEALDRVCPYTDLFLYDIKTLCPDRFKEQIGEGFSKACRHLREITERGNAVLVRIPVIPGFNDDSQSMEEIITFLHTLPGIHRVHLLPFHRIGAEKYHRLNRQWGMGDQPALQSEELEPFVRQFRAAGFEVEHD